LKPYKEINIKRNKICYFYKYIFEKLNIFPEITTLNNNWLEIDKMPYNQQLQ